MFNLLYLTMLETSWSFFSLVRCDYHLWYSHSINYDIYAKLNGKRNWNCVSNRSNLNCLKYHLIYRREETLKYCFSYLIVCDIVTLWHDHFAIIVMPYNNALTKNIIGRMKRANEFALSITLDLNLELFSVKCHL